MLLYSFQERGLKTQCDGMGIERAFVFHLPSCFKYNISENKQPHEMTTFITKLLKTTKFRNLTHFPIMLALPLCIRDWFSYPSFLPFFFLSSFVLLFQIVNRPSPISEFIKKKKKKMISLCKSHLLNRVLLCAFHLRFLSFRIHSEGLQPGYLCGSVG